MTLLTEAGMREKVRSYIAANLVVYDEEVVFSDEDNIFALGFVNSLFAMQLLTFVEQEFDIVVDNDDMEIINFSSVSNIVNLVQKKKAGA